MHENWNGVDRNLEISIFDYGVLYNTKTEEFIYGTERDENDCYISFKSLKITDKECNDTINENWFDKDSFFSCNGSLESDWLLRNTVDKLDDLISYYGDEIVLGGGYGRKEYTVDEIKKLIYQPKTNVSFLIHPTTSDLIAYFPQLKYKSNGHRCDLKTCYSHIGQHSPCAAEYAKECRYAKPHEYMDLLNEINPLYNYNLNINNKNF